MVNMPLGPTILRPIAGIKFEINSFCALNCKISQFKHYVICVLLGIKYWLVTFETFLVFILFTFTFSEFRLYLFWHMKYLSMLPVSHSYDSPVIRDILLL